MPELRRRKAGRMIRYGTQVISVVTVPQKSSTSTQPIVCSNVSQARKKTRYERNSFSAKALSGFCENHLLPVVVRFTAVAFIPLAPLADKLVMDAPASLSGSARLSN